MDAKQTKYKSKHYKPNRICRKMRSQWLLRVLMGVILVMVLVVPTMGHAGNRLVTNRIAYRAGNAEADEPNGNAEQDPSVEEVDVRAGGDAEEVAAEDGKPEEGGEGDVGNESDKAGEDDDQGADGADEGYNANIAARARAGKDQGADDATEIDPNDVGTDYRYGFKGFGTTHEQMGQAHWPDVEYTEYQSTVSYPNKPSHKAMGMEPIFNFTHFLFDNTLTDEPPLPEGYVVSKYTETLVVGPKVESDDWRDILWSYWLYLL